MVFLDQIAAVNCQRRWIRAIKRFGKEEAFFKGHFPALPIVPGVYLVEGMAQAALVIFQESVRRIQSHEIPVLTHVESRFFRPVFPDQRVIFEASIKKATENAAIFTATTKNARTLVAESEMTFAVKRIAALAPHATQRATR